MKSLLLSAAIALALGACATTTSPTGRTQYVGAVSQAELNQLGAQAYAELKAQKPQSRDSRQNAYVRCVVNDLVAALPADSRQQGWETTLFVDDDANALVLPGGKLGVYPGVYEVATKQEQLAAVDAHAIGRVLAHHHNERITRRAGAAGVVQLLG